ncbi:MULTISPECIES: SHOCT domain-containing protein [unclassified Rhodococcus (in: high G+C Gram-positive bacteria)]|uniref:SHOCT domain-containing protein n=1 Tax=unclassified Rhodococcus (in: high G+C Gram-positive bacteria) TaxID=192944 RepID=UPI001639F3D8|nr:MULTISPECIES: SHOCT domain-containing protein [unclassified Rhodococcus (in: high G+C Gram-positive bacteria)]MBC2641471.1 SHOCT domain-containing protein [Rhodococcus sp. 3A]MBC2893784.1 SHOCT domain-containing protein [Rhodococcus sp. 4CII]
MVFRGPRRVGRPGLLGTVARTAVITGTARATSNAMNRRAANKDAEAQARADQAAQQQYAEQQAAQQQAAPPPPAPAPAGGDDLVSRLQELARLKEAGVLTDDEFAAAKAKLLGS